MRSAIRANEANRDSDLTVSVVNPDQSVFLRFSRILKTSPKFFECRFEKVDLTALLDEA